MNKVIILFLLIVLSTSCESSEKTKIKKQTDIHKVIVLKVMQVNEYTYLFVLDNNEEKWIAAPSVKAEVGKTYYFKNGMEMTNFESKELDRKFEKIYFINMLSADSTMSVNSTLKGSITKNDLVHQAAKPKIEKEKVQMQPTKGIISIADLYENIESYKGKTIKIRGKVTKYNPAILKRNWIHLQDGTAFNDKFDFTATITKEVKVGDFVTIEGVISVNKDFGYGYVYEIIMENASLVN